MLVNSERFGSSLASAFSSGGSSSLDHNVVLMANHGFTTVGTSVKQAVYRAVYTHNNAGVQANALMLRNASLAVNAEKVGALRYLNEEQTVGGMKLNDASQERPWSLWVKEVESSPLYVNKLKDSVPTQDIELQYSKTSL
jgi:hypothetical protein